MSSTTIKYKRILSSSSDLSGGMGGNITVVANYSALPLVSTVPAQFYWCSSSQGTSWLPGSLGGTYYSAGLYYSNGITWEYIDVPYQATQSDVNTGTNTDRFITPATLTNWTGLDNYVPYTGATTNVNLGTNTLTTPQIIGVSNTLKVGATTDQILIGTTTAPLGSLTIRQRIGSGTHTFDFGSYNSTYAAIWVNQATPSTTNYTLLGNGSISELMSTGTTYLSISGVAKMTLNSNTVNWGIPLYITKVIAPQFYVRYDGSNYLSTSVSSTGLTTFDAVGSGAGFVFSDSISLPYVAKTSTYTITTNDYTINCTTGIFTVTLPTAVGVTGRIYNIKNSGTGVITLATTSSQTIDGSTTQSIIAGECLTVQSTGTNWIVI